MYFISQMKLISTNKKKSLHFTWTHPIRVIRFSFLAHVIFSQNDVLMKDEIETVHRVEIVSWILVFIFYHNQLFNFWFHGRETSDFEIDLLDLTTRLNVTLFLPRYNFSKQHVHFLKTFVMNSAWFISSSNW